MRGKYVERSNGYIIFLDPPETQVNKVGKKFLKGTLPHIIFILKSGHIGNINS